MQRRFLVEGRVQGVGFRYFARQSARRLGVVGWARNTADGKVEVVAGGTERELGELAGLLRQGPPGSNVTSVQITEISSELDSLTSFDIKT